MSFFVIYSHESVDHVKEQNSHRLTQIQYGRGGEGGEETKKQKEGMLERRTDQQT